MADSSEDDRKLTVEEKAAQEAALLEAPESPSDAKVKPALKKKTQRTGQQAKKALKWDEVAIEEHDLLRGTRMKIDEPNTPYIHYDSGQDSDDSRRAKSPITQKHALSWDTLQNRLDSVAAVQEAFPSSPSSHGGDHSEVDDNRQDEMKKLEFKEHRKRHYNEMELVRRFRQEHPDAVDVGAEADDEDDGAD
jgi:protein phosphatase inhibitor 2